MNYSADCPVCRYQHDFATKREMDKAWRGWWRRLRSLAKENANLKV